MVGMYLFVGTDDQGEGLPPGSFLPDIVTSNNLSVRDSTAAITYSNQLINELVMSLILLARSMLAKKRRRCIAVCKGSLMITPSIHVVCSGGRWSVRSNHRLLVQHPHRRRRCGAWESWGKWEIKHVVGCAGSTYMCWIYNPWISPPAPRSWPAWFAFIIDHRTTPFGFIWPTSLSSLACIACLRPWEGWTYM